MRLFTIFALVFPLACAGADAPKIRIEGQVFITRADAASVKLSSVAVQFVEKKTAEQIIDGLIHIHSLEEENEDLRKRAFSLVGAIPNMKREQADIARKTLAELHAQTFANNKELASLKPLCLLDPSRRVWNVFDSAPDAKWSAARTVQTDTEGFFSAEMPAGDWYLVAWSKRRVADSEEKYLWMLEAKPGEKNLLNNSNLYLRR